MASVKAVEILMVEDNAADVEIVREALTEWQILNHLSVVSDGAEALRFLRKSNSYREAPRPDLILLDLNLPKKTGRQVLEEVKSDEDLCVIPVVVLTSSASEEDITASYKLHANAYIRKPLRFDQLLITMKAIEQFWFTVAKLPSRRDS
jgi:CheY-like chemotaxis protein